MPDGSVVNVVGGGGVARPLARGVKKPAGTRVQLERSGGRLDIEIPPEGFTGSSFGTGLFAIAWNAFVAVSQPCLWTGCAGADVLAGITDPYSVHVGACPLTLDGFYAEVAATTSPTPLLRSQFWTFSALASGGVLFALFSAPFWFAGAQLAGQAFGGALTKERFAIGRSKFRIAQVAGVWHGMACRVVRALARRPAAGTWGLWFWTPALRSFD